MDKNTFESYLQQIHAKDYHGTDDDMPDAFDVWVERLEKDEVMQYAEDYSKEMNDLVKGFQKNLEKAMKGWEEATGELQLFERVAESMKETLDANHRS